MCVCCGLIINYCILVFRFYFPLFLSKLMYDNEMETEEDEI